MTSPQEWQEWYTGEVKYRLTEYKLRPTDGNKAVLMQALEAYQKAAERGQFVPSRMYRRPPPGKPSSSARLMPTVDTMGRKPPANAEPRLWIMYHFNRIGTLIWQFEQDPREGTKLPLVEALDEFQRFHQAQLHFVEPQTTQPQQ